MKRAKPRFWGQKPEGRRLGAAVFALGLLVLGLALGAPKVMAQGAAVEAPAAPAPAGTAAWRVTFFTYGQVGYKSQPLYQFTGNAAYDTGVGSTTVMAQLSPPEVYSDQNGLSKLLHMLPSMGVEYVMPSGVAFPAGIGFGGEYLHTNMVDVDVLGKTTVPAGVPLVEMDTYLLTGTVRFYVFEPNTRGINYYLGFGLGMLDGRFRTEYLGVVSRPGFSQLPFGVFRMGLDVLGDNWGFRYELSTINAEQVALESNPYQPSVTDLKFAGTGLTFALMYKF